jgi:hypothetical protein
VVTDKRKQYSYGHRHYGGGVGHWYIAHSEKGYFVGTEEPVWTFPFNESHWELEEPPAEVRAKYEELIGYDPEYEGEPFVNVVEMIDDGEGGGFNQPCRFGNLCAGHAVYCHNEKWLYGPRKCRRTWYTGGERRDEDCPGYEPNPHYAENVA